MSLKVTAKEQRVGVFVISPVGSIDSDTFSILEDRVDLILDSSPSEIVFDMRSVDYISSAGIRVILKAKKALKKNEGKVILVHLQPQVKKVFDIIKALPTMTVFTSIEELDDYLDKMQRKVKEE
jgi:anti-anti-sigma factor